MPALPAARGLGLPLARLVVVMAGVTSAPAWACGGGRRADAAAEPDAPLDAALVDAAPADAALADASTLDASDAARADDAWAPLDASGDGPVDAGLDGVVELPDASVEPPDVCAALTRSLVVLSEEVGTAGGEVTVIVAPVPGTDEVWVAERGGLVRAWRAGAWADAPWLDLREVIGALGPATVDRGILGFAVHPEHARNGRFFVAYEPGDERPDARSFVLAEHRRSATDPGVASPDAVARVLVQTDREPGNPGGPVAFGADGFLYLGLGDGGGSGDDHGTIGRAQSLDTWFGKVLRLDVDVRPAGPAPGNPWFEGSRPEIWALGVRDPRGIAFDRERGELYLADRGELGWDEVDMQPARSPGGESYGWRVYEGLEVFDRDLEPVVDAHAAPAAVVQRTSDPVVRGACGIVGGIVVRGGAVPPLEGVYLFGDACSADLAALYLEGGHVRGPCRISGVLGPDEATSAIGAGPSGEPWIAARPSGRILRITAP